MIDLDKDALYSILISKDDEIDKLKAEIARFRKALEEIVGSGDYDCKVCMDMNSVACAALEGKEK